MPTVLQEQKSKLFSHQVHGYLEQTEQNRRGQTLSLHAVGNFENVKDEYLWWMQAKFASEWFQPETGCKTNVLAVLKACIRTRDLKKGKQAHAQAVQSGEDLNTFVATAFINMYTKCGSMVDAQQMFDSMKQPDVVSWNVLILGYVNNGEGPTALDLFTRMVTEGIAPDPITCVAALKACTSFSMKEQAECRDTVKKIHNLAVENGNLDVYVQNTLVDMYAKCGSMVDAREMFDSMTQPDVVSWTALILGYAENGQGRFSLNLFVRMRSEGPASNNVTFMAALRACISIAAEGELTECCDRGKEIHNISVESDCSSGVYVHNALVDMYVKCGSMTDAREVFESMTQQDVVSWTALILGYADNGQADTALDLFCRMGSEGPTPDPVTIVAALKACIILIVQHGTSELAESSGKVIHNLAVENGCNSDVHVQSTLVDLYAKCGSTVDAHQVFDTMRHPDVVSWTVVILGYADNRLGHYALDLFTRMRTEGPAPNSVTFVAALKACTSLAVEGGLVECRDRGKGIHSLAAETGCNLHVYVQNTLIGMYAKCGSMVDAHDVFGSMSDPGVLSWSVLISGYADNGQGHSALELLTRMRMEGHAPDSLTFVAALKACGSIGALEFGRTIHEELDTENDLDVVLVTCLVDFYAKCGSLVEARSVFDLHADTRDMITWTALLAGFSSCGDTQAVFGLFEEMQDAGFQPNGVTFLCILACCSHAGLVEKGKECFDAMYSKYGIVPTVEHYNCMTDIFGRANKLDDAMALLQYMPCPNDVTCMTVLGACQKWKQVEAIKSCIIDRDVGTSSVSVKGWDMNGILE